MKPIGLLSVARQRRAAFPPVGRAIAFCGLSPARGRQPTTDDKTRSSVLPATRQHEAHGLLSVARQRRAAFPPVGRAIAFCGLSPARGRQPTTDDKTRSSVLPATRQHEAHGLLSVARQRRAAFPPVGRAIAFCGLSPARGRQPTTDDKTRSSVLPATRQHEARGLLSVARQRRAAFPPVGRAIAFCGLSPARGRQPTTDDKTRSSVLPATRQHEAHGLLSVARQRRAALPPVGRAIAFCGLSPARGRQPTTDDKTRSSVQPATH